jgi:3-deoxy-D-manno-octulosonate 8-phosphate phosphatase (KDO 8-P phosphatase)
LKQTLNTNLYANYPQALERAQDIRLLILDVDGVLTDGSLFISPDGVEHLKVFDSLDGHGLKMLISKGIQVAIITGRNSPMVKMRAQALGIEHVLMGVDDKKSAFFKLLAQLNIQTTDCAAMGDDWPDLAVLTQVRFAAAPANAHLEVLQIAHYVCSKQGGSGAVREICDLILMAQNHYQDLLAEAKK